MNHSVKYMLVYAFLFLAMALHAQLISVRSLVSSDSLMIGDQVNFTLRVEAAPDLPFNMPMLQDTLSSSLELLSPVMGDTSLSDDGQVVEHSYLMTSFEAGMHMLPAQEVRYEYNGQVDTARSMPLMIRVYEPEVDTTQAIRDIKAPINTPLSFRELLPWMLLGLGVLLLGTLVAALIWIYLRHRKNPEIFSMKPLEPPHVEAFRQLDELKEAKLWEQGQVKAFYTRLTEITRHYIERQYGIPAMEQTTDDILDAFRASNLDDPLLDDMLEELLELADLVKFAREDPLPLENQTNLNNAYLFIQKTFPMFHSEMEEAEEKQEERHD